MQMQPAGIKTWNFKDVLFCKYLKSHKESTARIWPVSQVLPFGDDEQLGSFFRPPQESKNWKKWTAKKSLFLHCGRSRVWSYFFHFLMIHDESSYQIWTTSNFRNSDDFESFRFWKQGSQKSKNYDRTVWTFLQLCLNLCGINDWYLTSSQPFWAF